MPTYPLPTLAFQVAPTGVSAPPLEDIINSQVATAQSIFGADIYLTDDTQDYEALAITCQAIFDANQSGIATYQSFSPSSATGNALASNVKINGIQKEIPTNSTAVLVISGTIGTIIPAGEVQDGNGNIWAIPPNTIIPSAGTIDVTGTCQTPGAITADPGAISIIFTPVAGPSGSPGWQTVTNPSAATVGAPVESDGALRQRQTISTSIAAQTPLEAITAAVANVSGVTRSYVYENDTDSTDGNGVPSHSISAVVAGGDIAAIAGVIEAKKAPGTGTYGTTTVTAIDPGGLPIDISFFELAVVPIFGAITILSLPGAGYVSTTGEVILAALVDFLNASPIGGVNGEVYLNQLLGVASLQGTPPVIGPLLSAILNGALPSSLQGLGSTVVVTSLTIGLSSGSLGSSNIPITFNEAATSATGSILLTVT